MESYVSPAACAPYGSTQTSRQKPHQIDRANATERHEREAHEIEMVWFGGQAGGSPTARAFSARSTISLTTVADSPAELPCCVPHLTRQGHTHFRA